MQPDAVNCCVWPGTRPTGVGATVTLEPTMTWAVAVWLPVSATFTVSVPHVEPAVYRPLDEIVPPDAFVLIDQVYEAVPPAT